MGSFAAQESVLDHSDGVDGLALSGSGALDGLVRLAQSGELAPAEIMTAAFAADSRAGAEQAAIYRPSDISSIWEVATRGHNSAEW